MLETFNAARNDEYEEVNGRCPEFLAGLARENSWPFHVPGT